MRPITIAVFLARLALTLPALLGTAVMAVFTPVMLFAMVLLDLATNDGRDVSRMTRDTIELALSPLTTLWKRRSVL